VNCQLRGFDDDVDVFSQVISPVHGFSVFHSTDQIVHHLCKKAETREQRLTLPSTCYVNQKQKTRPKHLNIQVKVPLGGGRYAELTEWNGSKRVDLRFWKTETIPTKVGASLSFL
jgi:hypothetical protein